MTAISTVFFDLGSTLFYYDLPWPDSYPEFANPLLEVLLVEGKYPINPVHFHRVFQKRFLLREPSPQDDYKEQNSLDLLKNVLEDLGCPPGNEGVLKRALRAMYTVSETHWQLDENTLDLLETLKANGYRIGAISNAADEEDVHIILAKLDLRKYFEVLVTSAGVGYAKPGAKIFQYALNEMFVTPRESIMIGDTLVYDIAGANQMGMKNIWVKRWTNPDGPTSEMLGIYPTYIAETLADVYQIVTTIR